MRARAAASVVLTAMVACALSACAFITPQQTTRTYTPSDGVNGRAGDVEIRNMLVVSSEDGKTVSLIGALVNTTDSDQVVTLEYPTAAGSESQRIQVPSGLLALRTDAEAGTDTANGTATDSVVLDGVDATLGSLFQVSFVQGDSSASLKLPVLPGTLPEYASLVPTPTPTPTKTKKTDDTESPTPDATESSTTN